MLVDPLLLHVFCAFLSFFPFVTEKEEKTCFNSETNDFDQGMLCGAPVHCSKYTKGVGALRGDVHC